MKRSLLAEIFASSLWLASSCAANGNADELVYDESGEQSAIVGMTGDERVQRLRRIRHDAAAECVGSQFLIAGVAQAEGGLAYCYSERDREACKGPVSEDCGGGAILAGAVDGACSRQQGGLTMFQLDGGTYAQTVQREGRRILLLDGAIEAGTEFILDKLVQSRFVSGVSSRAQAALWLSEITFGSPKYDAFLDTMVTYYNGCTVGRTCSQADYEALTRLYDRGVRRVYEELPQSEWELSATEKAACGR